MIIERLTLEVQIAYSKRRRNRRMFANFEHVFKWNLHDEYRAFAAKFAQELFLLRKSHILM